MREHQRTRENIREQERTLEIKREHQKSRENIRDRERTSEIERKHQRTLENKGTVRLLVCLLPALFVRPASLSRSD